MKLKRFLPLIGIVIFIYIVHAIGLDKIFNALSGVKINYLIAGTIMMFGFFFFQAIKWASILKGQGIKVPFAYVFRVNVISQYYGVITPGKIGSLIKAVYLKKKINSSLAKAGSSVMIDRILDLIVVAFMGAAGMLIIADAFLIDFNKTLILMILIIAGCMAFLNKRVTRFFLKQFHTYFVPKKYKDTLRKGFHEFYGNFPKLNKLIFPTIITILGWLYIYVIAYVFALAFSVTEIPIIPFLMISAIGTIISLIPVTFSGIGTREAFLILTFGLYGVAPEKIVLMSLTGTLALTIVCMLAGLVAIYGRKEKITL